MNDVRTGSAAHGSAAATHREIREALGRAKFLLAGPGMEDRLQGCRIALLHVELAIALADEPGTAERPANVLDQRVLDGLKAAAGALGKPDVLWLTNGAGGVNVIRTAIETMERARADLATVQPAMSPSAPEVGSLFANGFSPGSIS